MPRSEMEGREPVETTEYVYDDAGRLVRSVTTRESRWTEQDLAEALALAQYRATLCPLHGGPMADCTSPYDIGPEFVVSSKRCRAQDELIAAQDASSKDRPGAVLWMVDKKSKVG